MPVAEPPINPEESHLTSVTQLDDGWVVRCTCPWKSALLTEEKYVEPVRERHEKLGSAS